MQTLWLARHANRQDFADPNWAATADWPDDPGLSPDGVEQARQLGRRVDALDVDRIVASPYLRTVQTAHHVATTTGHGVLLEPGLGEWLNDDWFDDVPNTRAPTALADRFGSVLPSSAPPCREPAYPESRHRALARLGATGTCLADRYADETLLLGECKFQSTPLGYDTLASLETHTAELRWTPEEGGERTERYALFSRSGFEDSVREAAAERTDLDLFSIGDVVDAHLD